MKRFQNTAVISWNPIGTQDSDGTLTPGEEQTKTIDCDIQPSSGNYNNRDEGDYIKSSYKIFCDLFSDAIPDGAKISFLGGEYKIISLFKFGNHIEIKI